MGEMAEKAEWWHKLSGRRKAAALHPPVIRIAIKFKTPGYVYEHKRHYDVVFPIPQTLREFTEALRQVKLGIALINDLVAVQEMAKDKLPQRVEESGYYDHINQ